MPNGYLGARMTRQFSAVEFLGRIIFLVQKIIKSAILVAKRSQDFEKASSAPYSLFCIQLSPSLELFTRVISVTIYRHKNHGILVFR